LRENQGREKEGTFFLGPDWSPSAFCLTEKWGWAGEHHMGPGVSGNIWVHVGCFGGRREAPLLVSRHGDATCARAGEVNQFPTAHLSIHCGEHSGLLLEMGCFRTGQYQCTVLNIINNIYFYIIKLV
jgi:hypothetical protein